MPAVRELEPVLRAGEWHLRDLRRFTLEHEPRHRAGRPWRPLRHRGRLPHHHVLPGVQPHHARLDDLERVEVDLARQDPRGRGCLGHSRLPVVEVLHGQGGRLDRRPDRHRLAPVGPRSAPAAATSSAARRLTASPSRTARSRRGTAHSGRTRPNTSGNAARRSTSPAWAPAAAPRGRRRPDLVDRVTDLAGG